jgi:hypothetical protein
MSESLMRKCKVCGKMIPIDVKSIGEIIYYDKNTYHKDCFANLCQQNILPGSRKNVQKWSDALNNITELRKETIQHFKPIIVRDTGYRLMLRLYNPTSIPNYIFQKLEAVYQGTWRNMSKKIPPKHLFDMWERKAEELKKMHKQMELNGKEMDPVQEINYDISVLINKYDSYLKWLEKQRIIDMEKNRSDLNNSSIQQIVDVNAIRISQQKKTNQDELDIAALVEDIFD